jgi:hypothetical protein
MNGGITHDQSDNRIYRHGSPSSSSSVEFTENTRQWFISVAVSLSIAVNILTGVLLYDAYKHMGDRITDEIKRKEQTEDLRRYDMDFFKQNDWASLKTQVEVHERLIETYGIARAVKAAKER